jgi:hypothetical protein
VDNIRNFSKLRHEESDDAIDLKLEVSKLIKNVTTTTPHYLLQKSAANYHGSNTEA